MIANFLKSAFRHIFKYKVQSFINLVGLSLGLTACTIIFLLVQYFTSFDVHHSNYDKIYRIVTESVVNDREDHTPGVPVPFADAFRTDFPEIEKVIHTTYYISGLVTITREDGTESDIQEDEGIAHVDPQFFEIFDWDFVQGNPTTALNEPNTVVITEKLAKKYFNSIEVLGKTVILDGEHTLKITGVVKEQPETTDFPFTFIVSNETLKPKRLKNGWGSIWSDDHIYFLMPEGLTKAELDERLVGFHFKYYGEDDRIKQTLYAQPLSEMHYDENYATYSYNNINKSNIWGLISVGIFLLLTSCINFINLATALSGRRAKEVGIRKVLGGNKASLMGQLLGETTIIVVISLIFSLGLTELGILKLNELLNTNLTVSFLSNIKLSAFLCSLVILVIVGAGLYPALKLSGYSPLRAIRSQTEAEPRKGMTARKTLVTTQFIISQFFIIGVLVVIRQVDYFKSTDMGFRKEAILLVDFPKSDLKKSKIFKAEALKHSAIQSVSISDAAPASGSLRGTNLYYSEDGEEYNSTYKRVDNDFFSTYDIQILAGEPLQEVDSMKNMLINQKLMKLLGETDPNAMIGRTIRTQGKKVPIIGVVKDFNTTSLHNEQLPLMLFNGDEDLYTAGVLFQLGKEDEVKKHLEAIYKQLYPEYTFEPAFFDEYVAEFYEGEVIMSNLLKVFGLVAIIISCLGLYGLVSFLAQLKTKEIGIRKVLGASKGNLLLIFSFGYVKLLLLAFVVAAPLGWWIGTEWLQEFENRVSITPDLFLFALLLNLFIAFSTASFHSFRTIRTNPADVLRMD